jgi:hypothetical protein
VRAACGAASTVAFITSVTPAALTILASVLQLDPLSLAPTSPASDPVSTVVFALGGMGILQGVIVVLFTLFGALIGVVSAGIERAVVRAQLKAAVSE